MESLALLVGIDRFMSECRAITNLIGNGVATVVISRWEGEVTPEQLRRKMSGTEKHSRSRTKCRLNRSLGAAHRGFTFDLLALRFGLAENHPDSGENERSADQ